MRGFLKPVEVASSAMEYVKFFQLKPGDQDLSLMTDDELTDFLKKNFVDPVDLILKNAPAQSQLRSNFSDADLIELVKLSLRRKDALTQAEQNVFAAADARQDLIQHFADSIDRYAVLVALEQNVGDSSGVQVAQLLSDLLGQEGFTVPKDLSSFPTNLLYPYAIEAVIPDAGTEAKPLNPAQENPFVAAQTAAADLGGDLNNVKTLLTIYASARDRDNPPMPDHPAPASDAVRVAFIDSGIDFVQYPDLGLFLGNGKNGQISSGDYADGDSNPWAPATELQELFHGSGTSATLLTLMAHLAPETLASRKLDLAMWKVDTIR